MPTLTVNFNEPVPKPVGGYRVRFWQSSNPSVVTTAFCTQSPYVNTNVTGSSIAGTIESICATGVYSTTASFIADQNNPANSTSTTQPVARSFRISNRLDTICSAALQTLYLSGNNPDLAPTLTVFTDSARTSPLAGFIYIQSSDGVIYNLNNASGVVGSATGQAC